MWSRSSEFGECVFALCTVIDRYVGVYAYLGRVIEYSAISDSAAAGQLAQRR
jgi:hypothetical protein